MEDPTLGSISSFLAFKNRSRLDNTSIQSKPRNQYMSTYANNFKGMFEIRPQKNLSGPNGHGSVDFAVDLCQTAKTLGHGS